MSHSHHFLLTPTKNDILLPFDRSSSNLDPASVYSTPTMALDIEAGHLLKFCVLLLVSLVIPLLSLKSGVFPALGSGGRMRRRRGSRRLPATYEPPAAVVAAVFEPLPTRRHFRQSHVGNRATRVVYTALSSDTDSDDSSPCPDPPFRLVFGKALRGEEPPFRGKSALKQPRPAHSPPRSRCARAPANKLSFAPANPASLAL